MRYLLLCLTTLATALANAQTFSYAKQFGAANVTVMSNIAGTDASGNTFAVIYFSGIVDFDPGAGTYNLNAANGGTVIEKLDASGNFVSARQVKLPAVSGSQLFLDANENVFITGYFSGTVDFDPGAGTYNLTSAGYDDIFIEKLDALGNFVWARQIGGQGIDQGSNIVVNSLGNIYITGTFGYVGNTTLDKTVDFDPDPVNSYTLTSSGARDGFICCLSGSGSFMWAQKQSVSTMRTDNVGNLYLRGSFSVDNANSNATYISKIDANGNKVWSQQISASRVDFTDLTPNDAGEVLVSGGFNGNIYIGQYNIVSTSVQDPFFTKLDAAGNVVWAKSIKGNGFAQNISFAADGNIYLTGYFAGTGNVDFDPGPAVFSLNCKGNIAAFIEKVNNTGNFVWAKQIGGEAKSTTQANRTFIKPNGDVYTLLSFSGAVDFDPNAGKYSLTSKGTKDLVICKMTQPNNGLREIYVDANKPGELNVSSYSLGKFLVKLPGLNENVLLTVYDMLGRAILHKTFKAGSEQSIELPSINGAYLLEAKYSDHVLTRKIAFQQNSGSLY